MSEEKWYALYTKPRAEKKVHAELQLKNYINYLPLQKTLKYWSDRKKWVEEPLFKSYIFLRINYEKTYREILEIKGVVKFIRIGKEIATIRDSQIEDIKLLLSNFEGVEIITQNFIPGNEVIVIAGPLKGHRGKIIDKSGKNYFSIDIEQIGAQMLIQLPSNYLQQV